MLKRTLTATALYAVFATPALLGSAAAIAQERDTMSFLSWNLPVYEETFRQWFAEFEEAHPTIEIEWLDKTGEDWATFYQTQVVAGSPPDIIDVQGLLWAEYMDADQLLDLTPFLEREPEIRDRFDENGLNLFSNDGKTYMLPFYFTKTLLLYNKLLFDEAGLDGPPESFDELMDYAEQLTGDGNTGFITLNFDWAYWALFAANDVHLYNDDLTAAAFNTPEAVEVLTRLANATAAGQIDKQSWTTRWVEPNSAFAAGNVGMHQASTSAVFWIAGRAEWMNSETVGIAPMPGGYAVPSAHGFGIAKDTENPEAAWDFIKLATSDRWQRVFADNFTILTLNTAVDEATIEGVRTTDPLKAEALELSTMFLDRLVLGDPNPLDARVKDAFYPEIQAALLGEKDPAEALAAAEVAVNRILSLGR